MFFFTRVPDVTVNSHGTAYPYDVTVTRREMEGFGFVIISSVTKSGSTLGEFIGTYSRRGLLLPSVEVTLSCVCGCGIASSCENRVTNSLWHLNAEVLREKLEHVVFTW